MNGYLKLNHNTHNKTNKQSLPDNNAVFSRLVGNNIVRARERVASVLIKLRIGPNTLTILSLPVALAATVFLAIGAGDMPGGSSEGKSWYGVIAAMILIGGCALDMLDGAVARNAGMITKGGAFLDSCCDRIADGGVFLGIMIYYFRNRQIDHSELFAIAAIVALINSECISYVKAKAEHFIDTCPVGYWQRGERLAAVLIGLFCGHIGTVMIMLAVSPAFTVLRRIVFGYRQIHRLENNKPPLNAKAKLTGIMRLAMWRYPRGTLPYDIITAANICVILFVDLQRL